MNYSTADMSLDDEIAELAETAGRSMAAIGGVLATAESCTGGWVAQAVTAVAGSSAWFDRGFVTYSNAAKMEQLNVREDTLNEAGAVSEMTVAQMAEGTLTQSRASLSVAISGIAGPGGGSADKPVGTVCFAWAQRGETARSETRVLPGDRREVRQRAVIVALRGVIDLCESR